MTLAHHASASLGGDIGLGLLEDRDRVDFTALRHARQERLFGAMEEAGFEACLFGREANVRYATGARRFWSAQSRPFSASCVVVGSTRTIRVGSASASLDGLPEAFKPDDILPPTWNQAKAIDALGDVPGFLAARRIAVDGMTPGFLASFGARWPDKQLVSAEAEMRRIRARKLPAEVTCLQTAAAIAEAALQAAIARIAPGTAEKDLQAAYLARMCELGTSTFGQQGTFTAIGQGGALRWVTGQNPLPDGAAVALAGSVLWAGYEGSLARTWWCGSTGPGKEDRQACHAWGELMAALTAECIAGSTGERLHAVFAKAAPAGASFSVYALGLGHEGVVAGSSLDPEVARARALDTDMVVAVRAFVPSASGGYLGEDMYLVGPDAAQRITSIGNGPLAA